MPLRNSLCFLPSSSLGIDDHVPKRAPARIPAPPEAGHVTQKTLPSPQVKMPTPASPHPPAHAGVGRGSRHHPRGLLRALPV